MKESQQEREGVGSKEVRGKGETGGRGGHAGGGWAPSVAAPRMSAACTSRCWLHDGGHILHILVTVLPSPSDYLPTSCEEEEVQEGLQGSMTLTPRPTPPHSSCRLWAEGGQESQEAEGLIWAGKQRALSECASL